MLHRTDIVWKVFGIDKAAEGHDPTFFERPHLEQIVEDSYKPYGYLAFSFAHEEQTVTGSHMTCVLLRSQPYVSDGN